MSQETLQNQTNSAEILRKFCGNSVEILHGFRADSVKLLCSMELLYYFRGECLPFSRIDTSLFTDLSLQS